MSSFAPTADYLPHGDAFRFVDRIVSVEDRHIVATRIVPHDEPWTQAHFPGDAIVPGVLLIEGMAQTAGILSHFLVGQDSRRLPGRLASVRSAQFLRAVRPGALLTYFAKLITCVRPLHHFDCRIEVEGDIIAKASLVIAFFADTASPDRFVGHNRAQ